MASRPTQEGTPYHDGHQDPFLLPASPRPLAGGSGSTRPLLPPPGGTARPLVREGVGRPTLRGRRQAIGGPGRLLRAPARHVLRRHPLGAPTDGGRLGIRERFGLEVSRRFFE